MSPIAAAFHEYYVFGTHDIVILIYFFFGIFVFCYITKIQITLCIFIAVIIVFSTHEYKDMIPAIFFQWLYDIKILWVEIFLDIIHEGHQFFVFLAFYFRFSAMLQIIIINMASHISNDISDMSLALLEKEISITEIYADTKA